MGGNGWNGNGDVVKSCELRRKMKKKWKIKWKKIREKKMNNEN